MTLSPTTVLQTLKTHDVDAFHYATDVATACHFLRTGAMASHLHTQLNPQPDDNPGAATASATLFLDSSDVHAHQHRPNKCGPVTFVFDAAIVLADGIRQVRLARLPNQDWETPENKECWYQDDATLSAGFKPQQHEHMLALQHLGQELFYGRHLRLLIVDDPQRALPDGSDLHRTAMQALKAAAAAHEPALSIERRWCHPNCSCVAKYRDADPAIFQPSASAEKSTQPPQLA